MITKQTVRRESFFHFRVSTIRFRSVNFTQFEQYLLEHKYLVSKYLLTIGTRLVNYKCILYVSTRKVLVFAPSPGIIG